MLCPFDHLSFVLQFYDFIFFLMSLAHVQGNMLDLVHDMLMKMLIFYPEAPYYAVACHTGNEDHFLKAVYRFD